MDFRTFYLGKPPPQREAFAKQAGTTVGTCNQIAYAGKQIELGLADVLVTLAAGELTLDDLALTDRALHQRRVREGAPTVPTPEKVA